VEIKLDTRDMVSPNAVGEFSRNWAFKKNHRDDYGCYSTFELVDGFKLVDVSTYPKVIEFFTGCETIDSNDVHCYYHPDNDFLILWHWDGDGALLISVDDRFAYNGDCKKSNTWEWLGDDKYLTIYLASFRRLRKWCRKNV